MTDRELEEVRTNHFKISITRKEGSLTETDQDYLFEFLRYLVANLRSDLNTIAKYLLINNREEQIDFSLKTDLPFFPELIQEKIQDFQTLNVYDQANEFDFTTTGEDSDDLDF